MKSSIRLILAVLALLVSLVWSSRPAEALNTCLIRNDQSCTTPGATSYCVWSDGAEGYCLCLESTHRWECY